MTIAARWLPEGQLEFLGRIDHQVKVREFGIELGEIESHLMATGRFSDAIVTVSESEARGEHLVAHVVPVSEWPIVDDRR